MSNDQRQWQRSTALSYRQHKQDEAAGKRISMTEHALDVLAANYVGTTPQQVKAWRCGQS